MNQEQFLKEISKVNHSTFMTIHEYETSQGEIADYNIVFGISYKEALKRSIETLTHYEPINDLETQAKQELLESFNNSLNKEEETFYTDGYEPVYFNDKLVKGLKLHTKTKNIHLYGSIVNKRVIKQGSSKKTNKKELTSAKDKLRNMCSVGKYRQFIIKENQLDKLVLNKKDISPPK